MKTKVLNYRVIIEPEKYEDGSTVYVSHVPTLGISDYGDSIDETLKHTQEAMELYIETLIEEKLPVPDPDPDQFIVTNQKITINTGLIVN